MSVQEYRRREFIRAERIAENGVVFTARGAVWGNEGDYLVHRDGEVWYCDQESFEDEWEVIPKNVSEARKFTPDGKTVDQVLEFFRDNPDEVERVKGLERLGVGRKGITEYEIR